MPVNLTKCDYCDCRFRVKTVLKPWIGYFKGKLTYHWYYICPKCVGINTIRYWNEHINPVYDKWVDLGIKVRLEKKKLNYDLIVEEFESVKEELNMLNEQIEEILI